MPATFRSEEAKNRNDNWKNSEHEKVLESIEIHDTEADYKESLENPKKIIY